MNIRKIASATLIAFITILPTISHASPPSNQSVDLSTKEHYISFYGAKFILLDTYTNPNTAKDFYLNEYQEIFSSAQQEFSLPDLSINTATAYKETISSKNISETQYKAVLGFLDIYENDVENDLINKSLADIRNSIENNELSVEEGIESARMLMPNKPGNGNDRPFYSERNSGINLAAARQYASKYAPAGQYNRKYGYEYKRAGWTDFGPIGADCTNFASQVLLAGGASMDSSSNPNQGWWWKGMSSKSISWINANAFKNYMKSGYSNRNWAYFVDNVRSGDFIGVDFYSDGSVDHIGFVHTADSPHKNLLIAQHTRDYLAWNGNWSQSSGTGTYYRIRR